MTAEQGVGGWYQEGSEQIRRDIFQVQVYWKLYESLEELTRKRDNEFGEDDNVSRRGGNVINKVYQRRMDGDLNKNKPF